MFEMVVTWRSQEDVSIQTSTSKEFQGVSFISVFIYTDDLLLTGNESIMIKV